MVRDNSEDKAERILSIYTKLTQGKVINKAQQSHLYGVSERTIQRDIVDIQCFLQNQELETGEIQEITYSKRAGGYILQTKNRKCLDSKDVLAVGKILLESRALVKEELFPILHNLSRFCCDCENEKAVEDFLRNEMHHYVELQHKTKLLPRIWELEQAVYENRYIIVKYRKQKDHEIVERKLKPVGIMFSEFYFYLTAFIEDENHKDDEFPTIYRIDRIKNIKVRQDHFKVLYSNRFEEGEFRKRIQFMYGGKLRRIRFEYSGPSVEAVLDRLPTAVVEKAWEDKYVINAEVY